MTARRFPKLAVTYSPQLHDLRPAQRKLSVSTRGKSTVTAGSADAAGRSTNVRADRTRERLEKSMTSRTGGGVATPEPQFATLSQSVSDCGQISGMQMKRRN